VYNVPHAPEGSYRWEGDRVIISLTAANVLREIGTAVRLTLGQYEGSEERIIVVCSEEDTYQAFADRCTHNGKELYYLREENVFQCHSSRSHFDLEGQVIKGPAESALHLFPTRRVGDELVIEV
jgi:Rieske Fe-S protein